MSAPNTQVLVLDVATVAAGTGEERYVAQTMPGEWQVEAAYYTPATADAAHATNFTTLSLLQGATAIVSDLSNETVAFVAGTARAFTMVNGVAREFGQGDVIKLTKVEDGSGGILDGAISIYLRKVRV